MVEDSSSAPMIRMCENVSYLKFGIISLNEARGNYISHIHILAWRVCGLRLPFDTG